MCSSGLKLWLPIRFVRLYLSCGSCKPGRGGHRWVLPCQRNRCCRQAERRGVRFSTHGFPLGVRKLASPGRAARDGRSGSCRCQSSLFVGSRARRPGAHDPKKAFAHLEHERYLRPEALIRTRDQRQQIAIRDSIDLSQAVEPVTDHHEVNALSAGAVSSSRSSRRASFQHPRARRSRRSPARRQGPPTTSRVARSRAAPQEARSRGRRRSCFGLLRRP
jgi:hypothetical protein